MAEHTGKSVIFENVAKYFGTTAALREVNLDINAGEFFTLLGPSGSGKTTLLKVLAGFEGLSKGRVMLDGKDIGPVSVAKRNIGMVFQNYALFPHMTVAGNVAFPLEMRSQPSNTIKQRVDGALSLVDMNDYGHRFPHQLSGGQQQRVAVARALVFEPDILLMDEPLGALDKNLRQSLQFELKQLHRRLGVTILYVTHDQEEAMHLSDRIVVLNNGRVEQIGTPETLYFNPASEFVARFVGECNFITDETNRIAGGKIYGVRPEFLQFVTEGNDGGIVHHAKVEEIIFIGTGYKIHLTDGAASFLALSSTHPERLGIAIGDRVKIGFDPEHAFVL